MGTGHHCPSEPWRGSASHHEELSLEVAARSPVLSLDSSHKTWQEGAGVLSVYRLITGTSRGGAGITCGRPMNGGQALFPRVSVSVWDSSCSTIQHTAHCGQQPGLRGGDRSGSQRRRGCAKIPGVCNPERVAPWEDGPELTHSPQGGTEAEGGQRGWGEEGRISV